VSDYKLTPEPLQCGHCGNKLPLKIVGEVKWTVPESDEKGVNASEFLWEILICPTCECETVRKRIWYPDLDDYDYDADTYEIIGKTPYYQFEILYPTNKRSFHHLPKLVARSYEIALHVLPVEPIAFAVFIGRTLESICEDKNATGRNLQKKLDDLATKGIIPATLANMARHIREIRNSGVHDMTLENISREDALLLREFCEAILEYVYEAPAMLQQAEKRFSAVIPKPPTTV
jgi:hypothetical protein